MRMFILPHIEFSSKRFEFVVGYYRDELYVNVRTIAAKKFIHSKRGTWQVVNYLKDYLTVDDLRRLEQFIFEQI